MKDAEKLYSDMSFKISDKANRLYFLFFSSFCFSVGLLFLAIIQQSHKNAQKELCDANRILYENEKSLQRAQSIAQIGSWEWDVVNNHLRLSDEMCQIYGIDSPDQFFNIWDVMEQTLHPDDKAYVFSEVKKTSQTGKGKKLTYRVVRQNGEVRWIDAMPPEAKKMATDGTPLSMIGTAQDITERKRAEEALRHEKEFTESALNSQLDTFFVFDPTTGKAIRWNRAFKDITGYTNEEITEMVAPNAYYSPKDLERATSFTQKVLETGIGTIELELICKDGRKIPTEYSVSAVKDEAGNPKYFIAIGRDITERKQSEAVQEKLKIQLMQVQKMESIGTLAGGIAHNFNNVLMGIQGRTSLLMMNKDSSHPDIEHLKGIEEYVHNAAALTNNLLGFARGGKYEVRPTNLNEFIRHENNMFAQTKKEIKVHGKYEKNIGTVEIEHSQIKQVLMNLYVNAGQAMPRGGDLYVQTESVTLYKDYVKSYEVDPGRYVRISVTDTGVGMDEVTREKIFDPFFTTREVGKGTGLGLSSVYGIVKNHGGFITVYSEKGEGSTFNIFLPASEKEVLKQKALAQKILKGEETILLVDDEEMITEVAEQMLKNLGYRVLVARSGKKAIEIFETGKNDIDLVILDMIMPGMGGGEAYDRLKEIRPDIKFLLSSGYTINGRAQEIMDRGCDGFVQKPFNTKEISQKIREALDKAS